MPRVEGLRDVSRGAPAAALTEPVPSEMLADEHYAYQLVERIGWTVVDAERREQAVRDHNGGSAAAAPTRSVRRATARRASSRRATARIRQGDIEASVIDFLAQHPGSTAGDLAKRLNLNPETVSSRLTQLAKTGEIKKAPHGYTPTHAARRALPVQGGPARRSTENEPGDP